MLGIFGGIASTACRDRDNRQLRMFTARAATRRIVTADRVDSAAISRLAGRVSGIASVGLNAIELVN